MSFNPMDKSFNILRNDAIERGMLDLAIVYGYSQIKTREEFLNTQMTDKERYKFLE